MRVTVLHSLPRRSPVARGLQGDTNARQKGYYADALRKVHGYPFRIGQFVIHCHLSLAFLKAQPIHESSKENVLGAGTMHFTLTQGYK